MIAATVVIVYEICNAENKMKNTLNALSILSIIIYLLYSLGLDHHIQLKPW